MNVFENHTINYYYCYLFLKYLLLFMMLYAALVSSLFLEILLSSSNPFMYANF